MTTLQALILGIIQGITEFLPISSSGHIVIFPYLFGWTIPPEQIFPFGVLVQIGTLISVIIYFREDLKQITGSLLKGIKKKDLFHEPQSRVGIFVLAATLPAGIVGLLLKNQIERAFNRPLLAGLALLVTSVLLISSERIGQKKRNVSKMDWIDAGLMGVIQAFSVFPGISRSGSTISAGLIRNLDRNTASHFSFLMAIPIMFLAGIVGIIDLTKVPNLSQFLPVMLIGFTTAAVAGYVSIRWLLKYIKGNSLLPFSLYCLILGLGTIALTAFPGFTYLSRPDASNVNEQYIISYSSQVDWMLPDINHCAEKLLDNTYVISESAQIPANALPFIHVSLEGSQSTRENIYEVGSVALSLFANTSNPINALTEDALKRIVSGSIVNYDQLQDICADCDLNLDNEEMGQSISIWMYAPESPYRIEILTQLKISTLTSEAYLSPSPAALLNMLQMQDDAIGFLPDQVRHSNIKKVDLIGESIIFSGEITLLAETNAAPDSVQTAFINCMAASN